MHDMTLENRPWYTGVTKYQWVVLIIACLGWVFDVFEGQIFVASMNEAMPSLVPADATKGTIGYLNNWALGSFLLGGALGGIVFGMLSDRIGRTKTMVYTILLYSLFTSLTAFVKSPWQMIALRFIVAMGVGGEWAVASAMVAEVFPKRARAWSLGIFHASSVLGTLLAIAAGYWIIGNVSLRATLAERGAGLSQTLGIDPSTLSWRVGFLIGVVPALLTIWIRSRLEEPQKWHEAKAAEKIDSTQQTGRITDLFRGVLLRRTIVGILLAAIGMATFWGVHIYGKDLARQAKTAEISPTPAPAPASAPGQPAAAAATKLSAEQNATIKQFEMLGMLMTTIGGGIGLLCFGPICERFGRRGAFLLYHLGGVVMGLLLFRVLHDVSSNMLLVLLPVFGFLTLGMHAGYAIYFPELFPTRLRGTGGGVCFNAGRVIAVPALLVSGWMQKDWGYSLQQAVTILSMLYLLGVIVLIFAPETKGQELPE